MSLRSSTKVAVLQCLGTNVERGAKHHVLSGDRRRGSSVVLGQPEIEHLHRVRLAPTPAREDVRRLDVTLDQPDAVGLLETAGRLSNDVDYPFRRLRSIAGDQ